MIADHKLSNESTESPRWCSELCEAILQSVEEINQSKKIDESFDFNKVKLTITDGERWSTDRLLKPRYGNNLKVVTHALIDKVLHYLNYKFNCLKLVVINFFLD